ncbi:MAG: hypothetical protein ACRD12_23070 [Acidimicrobiales bacterium]
MCQSNEHAFDALIAALAARAAGLGWSAPPPVELRHLAEAEGWIHIPTCAIETLVGQE